jgi:hypothetical protein
MKLILQSSLYVLDAKLFFGTKVNGASSMKKIVLKMDKHFLLGLETGILEFAARQDKMGISVI